MFKQEIFTIKNDLENRNQNQENLISDYIKKRLDKSLNSYYTQLQSSYNSIVNSYGLSLKSIKKILKEGT